MAKNTIRTSKKDEKFLAGLCEGLSVTGACGKAGYSRSSAYLYRKNDEDFEAAWDAAVESGTDVLEDIAFQRAKDQSDTLVIFLLKARRRDKYMDRAVRELTGEVKHKHLGVSQTEAFVLESLGEDTKEVTTH